MVTPGGASSAAARSNAPLYEARRRAPEIPTIVAIACSIGADHTSRKVEHERLGRRALRGELERGLVLDRRAVPLLEDASVHRDLAARHLDPPAASGRERVAHA